MKIVLGIERLMSEPDLVLGAHAKRSGAPRSHTIIMLMPERQEPRGVVFIVS